MINIIEFTNKQNLTLASLRAIKDSDIIISYSFDIKDIEELLNQDSFYDKVESLDYHSFDDNQSVDILLIEDLSDDDLDDDNFSKYMDLNVKACEIAILKSFEGKNVSLISNGYFRFGFNNLIYQIASKYSNNLEIKIYPTVSAIDYSSSLVGAPLDDVVVINFANYLIPLSEFERKIENAIKANFVLAIHNPIYNKDLFNKFKEIALKNLSKNTILAIVDIRDNSKEIIQLDDLNQFIDKINEFSFIILGNKASYKEDELMITPRSYIIKNEIISHTREFFEKYLNNESPCGLDYDCDYLPCHKELEVCDFCYCPFYPCGERSTGGKWIKDKNVWDCRDCIWIHKEQTDKCIREKIENLLVEVEDLNLKKEELLHIRRKCLFKSD